MSFYNPINEADHERVLDELISRLPPSASCWRVLDIGCGRSEFMIRLATRLQRYNMTILDQSNNISSSPSSPTAATEIKDDNNLATTLVVPIMPSACHLIGIDSSPLVSQLVLASASVGLLSPVSDAIGSRSFEPSKVPSMVSTMTDASGSFNLTMGALRFEHHVADYVEWLARLSSTSTSTSSSLVLPTTTDEIIKVTKLVAASVYAPSVVICIGSGHCLRTAGVIATARAIAQFAPLMVVGDICWRGAPSKEFLNELGYNDDDILTHDQHIAKLNAEVASIFPMPAFTHMDEYATP
jgi:hypothetical protein